MYLSISDKQTNKKYRKKRIEKFYIFASKVYSLKPTEFIGIKVFGPNRSPVKVAVDSKTNHATVEEKAPPVKPVSAGLTRMFSTREYLPLKANIVDC